MRAGAFTYLTAALDSENTSEYRVGRRSRETTDKDATQSPGMSRLTGLSQIGMVAMRLWELSTSDFYTSTRQGEDATESIYVTDWS